MAERKKKAVEKPDPLKPVQEKIKEQLEKLLMPEVEAPPISDTLEKAKAAIAQAVKAKQKVRKDWCCTECGHAGVQLRYNFASHNFYQSHMRVHLEDDEPCADNGEPLTGDDMRTMKEIAMPKAGYKKAS